MHILTRQVDRRAPLLPPRPGLGSSPPRVSVDCCRRLGHAGGGSHVSAAGAGGHGGWGPPSPALFFLLLGTTAVFLRLGLGLASATLRIRIRRGVVLRLADTRREKYRRRIATTTRGGPANLAQQKRQDCEQATIEAPHKPCRRTLCAERVLQVASCDTTKRASPRPAVSLRTTQRNSSLTINHSKLHPRPRGGLGA